MNRNLVKNFNIFLKHLMVKLFRILLWNTFKGNYKIKKLLVIVIIVINCQRPKTYELTLNPEILFDKNFKVSELTLSGIRIGQDANSIDTNLNRETADEAGWIGLKIGPSYRVIGKKVVAFHLGEKILSKLNIKTMEELEENFGKADDINNQRIMFHYYYYSRNLYIQWCAFPDGHYLCGIIVGYHEDLTLEKIQ